MLVPTHDSVLDLIEAVEGEDSGGDKEE